MAKIIIKIEKDDIKTCILGKNILVQCKDNIELIFTPESLQELLNDYTEIIKNKH